MIEMGDFFRTREDREDGEEEMEKIEVMGKNRLRDIILDFRFGLDEL